MIYGLRSGLTLKRLPQVLDQSEQAETTRMLQVLNDFISTESEHCLKWLEASMLIKYSGGRIRLLGKAEESLAIVQEAQNNQALYQHSILSNDTVRGSFVIKFTFFN